MLEKELCANTLAYVLLATNDHVTTRLIRNSKFWIDRNLKLKILYIHIKFCGKMSKNGNCVIKFLWVTSTSCHNSSTNIQQIIFTSVDALFYKLQAHVIFINVTYCDNLLYMVLCEYIKILKYKGFLQISIWIRFVRSTHFWTSNSLKNKDKTLTDFCEKYVTAFNFYGSRCIR